MKILGILLFFLQACSHSPYLSKIDDPENYTDQFVYTDLTGSFLMSREIKVESGKLFTRQQLYTSESVKKVLEKTVSVSKLGYLKIKNEKTPMIRPEASQHSIWFEGKLYFSQLKTSQEEKSMEVILKSPEKKWNKTDLIEYPSGTLFCYFTQIPECLKRIGFIMRSITSEIGSVNIKVIWDTYPYYMEQLSNLQEELFSDAKFTFEGEDKNDWRFTLEVQEQIIFYHFNKKLKFNKMYWVSQGISLELKER